MYGPFNRENIPGILFFKALRGNAEEKFQSGGDCLTRALTMFMERGAGFGISFRTQPETQLNNRIDCAGPQCLRQNRHHGFHLHVG